MWASRLNRGWTKYPYLPQVRDYPATYGIYSETPDFMPLIGKADPRESCVCHMVGCNAWGQASLSAAAALAAPLLGYRDMSETEQRTAGLFLNPSFPQHANWQGLLPGSDTAFDNSTCTESQFQPC